MHCRVFRRPRRANERPSLTLKAKIEIAVVMHLVPDGIRMPPHAVHQLMAMAFRRGASYVLEACVPSNRQPLMRAINWPQGSLIQKPEVRQLMETAFVYGAIHAFQARDTWECIGCAAIGLSPKEATMIENAKRMSCGHCAGQTFAIYTAKNLIVECLKCHNTSALVVATPTIDIEFGQNSEGRLCVLS